MGLKTLNPSKGFEISWFCRGEDLSWQLSWIFLVIHPIIATPTAARNIIACSFSPTSALWIQMTKKWPKIKKVRYHKIKKFFVFWKVGSLLIMYPDMFFHDLFILDPKNRVKVKSICPKFKLLRILFSKLASHPAQMWL